MADSDDDFFGGGPSRFKPTPAARASSPPRPSTSTITPSPAAKWETPPLSPPIRVASHQESGSDKEELQSESESVHGKPENDEQGSPSESGSGSGSVVTSASEEEDRSEDDPLSDLWDSADNDEECLASSKVSDEDEIHVSASHEYVQMRTSRGIEKVDLTPPQELLKEAEDQRHKFYRKKKADECIKECIHCLTFTRIVFHDLAPYQQAKCHGWLAKAYYELKDWAPQTYDHCEQGMKYLLKSDPHKVLDIGQEVIQAPIVPPTRAEVLETALLLYSLMGRSQLAMNKISDAEVNLNKAEAILKERQEIKGETMKNKFYWKNELTSAMARVKLCQRKFDDAYKGTKRVLTLIEKRYGEHDLKLIPILKELTKIEHKRERLDHAAEFAMRAYSIAKADLKETDVNLADTVKFLAMAYSNIPESDQADFYAESYFREAIADYEASIGEADKKTLHTYKALAEHYANRKRHTEAVQVLTQYLPKFKEGYGELSIKTIDILKLLASQYLQIGEIHNAAKHLRKAYESERKILGPNHAKTDITRKALDILLKNPTLKHMNEDQKMKSRPLFKNAIKSTTYLI